MPGTPATTPRYGVARYAQSDLAVFSPQFNQAVDAFDGSAKLTELNAEIARAEAAETAETTARTTADTAEATARTTADTNEASARVSGDVWQYLPVLSWTDQDTPSQPLNSILAMTFAPVMAGQSMSLIGVVTRCITVGSTPTQFTIQTDHGHGDGSLATVTGLGTVQPAAGRAVDQFATTGGVATPVALNRYDTVAVMLKMQGNSKGCAVGLLFGRTAP